MPHAHKKEMIRITGLVNRFGDHLIHDGIDLNVYEHEVLGIVGGSGTGKSVLLNCMLGLRTPSAGVIFRPHGVRKRDDPHTRAQQCQPTLNRRNSAAKTAYGGFKGNRV